MLISVEKQLRVSGHAQDGHDRGPEGDRTNTAISSSSRSPRTKHMTMRVFERYMMPYLREIGAGDTETFCVIREPTDWLGSWYRYRSRLRPGLRFAKEHQGRQLRGVRRGLSGETAARIRQDRRGIALCHRKERQAGGHAHVPLRQYRRDDAVSGGAVRGRDQVAQGQRLAREGSFSFRPRCGRGSRPSAPRTSRSMPISPGEAVAGTRNPMMPAPDFLCIGAQKAGTSWLDVMLRQHPGVFLPPMKEVHFYDFIYLPEHRRWIRAGFGKHLRAARRACRARGLFRPARGAAAARGRLVCGGLRPSRRRRPGDRRDHPGLFDPAGARGSPGCGRSTRR